MSFAEWEKPALSGLNSGIGLICFFIYGSLILSPVSLSPGQAAMSSVTLRPRRLPV